MFGERNVLARSLVGVSASAPYLHDGSVPTLRELLEAVRDSEMGNTGMLSGAELDDLEAYLQSL
jgi:cytochrome c peroxidase